MLVVAWGEKEEFDRKGLPILLTYMIRRQQLT